MFRSKKWLAGIGAVVVLVGLLLIFGGRLFHFSGRSSQEVDENKGSGDEATVAVQSSLTVDASKKLYPINPLFFGTNTLFWIEDDASMKDGKIAAQLKDLNVKLLRYPGGTVADNFHWKENKLDRIDWFPYEDGPEKMDADEFIELCRKVGAEPMIVVNTATWFRKGDVDGGAQEAADWVRHYNQDKGYNVKYWEIGNETYHHTVMSAEEYADLVVRYAKAMKQVDPTIKIGVNGHWNAKDVGTKERVKPGKLKEIQEAEDAVSGKVENDAFKELKDKLVEQNRLKGSPMWWPTVLDKAGEAADFAIIHWYFTPNQVDQLDGAVKELAGLIQQKVPGKHMPIALTEWNSTQEKNKTTEAEHALMMGEAALRFLDGGVEMSEYWPLRMKTGKFTMLNYSNNEPGSFGELFKLLSASINGNRVETTYSASGIYSFATLDKNNQLVICLINRSKANKPGIALDTPGFQAACAVGTLMATKTASAKTAVLNRQELKLLRNGAQWVVDLPGQSMAVIRMGK